MNGKTFATWILVMILLFTIVTGIGLLLSAIYPSNPFLLPWLISTIVLAFCLTTILIDNEQKGDTE